MEKGESDESSPTLTIRPIVLPPIPASLRVSWNNNGENLRQAGIFGYLAWIQSVMRIAYVDRVTEFIQSYTKETATAQVDGRTIDFSVKMIERALKLPSEGQLVEEMPGLTQSQFESWFEGPFPRTPKGCRLDAAKPQWKQWLKFVNDYLLFRPQRDTMNPRSIVAAMRTWNGEKMNWARAVQQGMYEEIESKRLEGTKSMELYSAFYITVCCEKLPPPAMFLGGPSSPGLTSSPSSSPERLSLEDAENERLKEQIKALQSMVDMKQEQLIKKGEAMVEYQNSNVRSLQELAQIMKEKMEKAIEADNLRKAVEASQMHVREKEKENMNLRSQLQQSEQLQETLKGCQEELTQSREEGRQLREKLRLQQVEMDTQNEVMSKRREVQLSNLPVPILPSASSTSVQSIVQLWEWESSCPAPRNLFHLYEIQRDLFLFTHGLTRSDWLDHSQFARIWHRSSEIGVENLFAEILARKHLQLSDPHAAFMVIGDMGARVLLYYASLESQWVGRYQLSAKEKRRVVSWQDYSTRISSQFYGQSNTSLQKWQLVLSGLYQQLKRGDLVTTLLENNVHRLSLVPSADLTASHYLFQFDKACNRLERYIRDASTMKKPLLNVHGQIQLELSPPSFTAPLVVIALPLWGSPLTLQYLGQYDRMFDNPEEKPIPTWAAISWLLEDYGMSRTEDVPGDIYYRRISRHWSPNPPPAVTNHPNFCTCPRRHKWDPQATLHSVEYNWPLIPGPKETAAQCQATYRRFYETHIRHLDPVCFRAAVFCNTIADWCDQWNVTIDMNRFSESHHEFLLLLKLQYRPTRWVRLVETMAITHFIEGAHRCLINEFPNTRAGPFDRFLRWQRLNAPELVARDEDLRRAVEKMEIRDKKRGAELTSRAPPNPYKQPRR